MTRTCRFSVSPVGTPSTRVLPYATWSAAMPRSGCQPEGALGDKCVVWVLSWEGMQHTSTVPSICALPSSMRARRPLGPCTPHALKGECACYVQLEQGD